MAIKQRLTLDEHKKYGEMLKRQHEELKELLKLATDDRLGRDADGKGAAKAVRRLVDNNLETRLYLDNILAQEHPKDYSLAVYYDQGMHNLAVGPVTKNWNRAAMATGNG